MLRKRENRDLDKMDALTVERDELKKTLETQQRVIQDANPRMHQVCQLVTLLKYYQYLTFLILVSLVEWILPLYSLSKIQILSAKFLLSRVLM